MSITFRANFAVIQPQFINILTHYIYILHCIQSYAGPRQCTTPKNDSVFRLEKLLKPQRMCILIAFSYNKKAFLPTFVVILFLLHIWPSLAQDRHKRKGHLTERKNIYCMYGGKKKPAQIRSLHIITYSTQYLSLWQHFFCTVFDLVNSRIIISDCPKRLFATKVTRDNC